MGNNSAQGVVLVRRKPKTASETELVRLITNQISYSGIGDFTRLVNDLDSAGIVIGEDAVAIKADKVVVRNGSTKTAMFSDGKLNASLIDADTITVNHLYAKSAQGGTIVGHFGNYDVDAAKISGVGYPLWLGSDNASGANFRVSQKGELYSVAGTIGGFDIKSDSLTSNNISGNNWTKLILTNGKIDFSSVDNRSIVLGTTVADLGVAKMLSISDMSTSGTFSNIGIEISTSDRSTHSDGAKPNYFVAVRTYVKNATRNYAMAGVGNIALEGFLAGTKYSECTVKYANTYHTGMFDMNENNVWFVQCTVSGSIMLLPKISVVREALGMSRSSTAKFRCLMWVIGRKGNTKSFNLRGRTSNTAYSASEYPLFLDRDGNSDNWDIGAGDSACIMLYYDGTDYYAQLLSLNR